MRAPYSRPVVLDRVLATKWSPRVAAAAAVLVFGAVLAVTPPGARAIYDLLLRSTDDAVTLEASYVVGAAALLALLALVLVAAVGSAIEVTLALLVRRGRR
jgi:hypothetical protein